MSTDARTVLDARDPSSPTPPRPLKRRTSNLQTRLEYKSELVTYFPSLPHASSSGRLQDAIRTPSHTGPHNTKSIRNAASASPTRFNPFRWLQNPTSRPPNPPTPSTRDRPRSLDASEAGPELNVYPRNYSYPLATVLESSIRRPSLLLTHGP